jgi:FtsH-binding integral membrane protein
MNKETRMKSIYEKFAVALMFVAMFCVLFALTLANPDEVKPLAIVSAVCIGFSLWFIRSKN